MIPLLARQPVAAAGGLRALLVGSALSLLALTNGCNEPITTTYELPEQAQPSEQAAGDSPQASRYQAAPAAKPRIKDKTFDDIKFDIEPDQAFERDMLPTEIEELAGNRIRIRGWMLPTFQRSGIKQFVLVRDNQECCFGPGAALYDCIMVEMEPGKSAEFETQQVAVEGTFNIDPFMGPDGKHLAVFHLNGESVE